MKILQLNFINNNNKKNLRDLEIPVCTTWKDYWMSWEKVSGK